MSAGPADSHRIDLLPWQDLAPDALRTDTVIVPIGCVEPHGRDAGRRGVGEALSAFLQRSFRLGRRRGGRLASGGDG